MSDDQRDTRNEAAYDAWFCRQVVAGKAAADAGQLISADEAEAEAATWRTELRRKATGAAA